MKLPILTLLFLLCVTASTVAFSDDSFVEGDYSCSAPEAVGCSGAHEDVGCAGDAGCSGRFHGRRDRGERWYPGKLLVRGVQVARGARGCG
jgi:hypothetical protein